MNHHFLHPVFHSLYARLTLWVMLTVIIVFAILTLIITLLSSSAVLVGSTENAQSRILCTTDLNFTHQRVSTLYYVLLHLFHLE